MKRSNRRRVLRGSAALTSAWALSLGCGFPLQGEATDGPDGDGAVVHEGRNESALRRARTCDDVLEEIRASVVARLVERAEQLRQPPGYYEGEPGIIVDDPVTPPPGGMPPPSDPSDNPLAGDSDDSGNASGEGQQDPSGDPGGFSGTTVQVSDVDEADIIKADDDNLYLLQGNLVLKLLAWPAEQTQLVGSAEIEGEPIEMFVRDGKVLVYSTVYRDFGQNQGYGYYPYPYYDYYYPYYSTSYTKLTVLDMSGDEAEVVRESYLEGYYVSSRRHDAAVRTVVQSWSKAPALDGVYIEYFTPFGQPYRQQDIDAQVDAWLDRTLWAVSETEIGDWLPRQYALIDGAIVEQEPSCGDYYSPDLDISQSGVTSIVSLDLDSDEGESALGGVTVLARAERVYANDDVVLLSQTDYGSFETDYTEQTTLHRFDLDGLDTSYTASGVIPGYVHNQFSLDEHEGYIRVSTTQNDWDPQPGEVAGPKNRVFTVATNGGWLDIYGQTEVFGQNEQIYSTRFLGDLGYVVTFRQIDPLFVVDLRRPRRPRVVGELEVTGFSNFMYPLDDGHLLTIGREASADGITQGISLSIFDVTDPRAPALAHRYVYEGDGYSSAEADHRAISFHPEGGRITFPLQNWQTGESTLEVFDVSLASGFARLGAISPAAREYTFDECALSLGYTEADLEWLHAEIEAYPEYEEYFLSQCRYQEQMRRGVMREDVVYGITTAAVYAHTEDALDGDPVGQAALPPAGYYGYPYPNPVPGGAMAGAGGGAFVGTAGTGGDFSNAGAAGSSMMGTGGTTGE